jgi:hypothetical protein
LQIVDYADVPQATVGGPVAGTHSLFYREVNLTIHKIGSYKRVVGFTSALENQPIGGVLGQESFFDRFAVRFDLPNGVFYVRTDLVEKSSPCFQPWAPD